MCRWEMCDVVSGVGFKSGVCSGRRVCAEAEERVESGIRRLRNEAVISGQTGVCLEAGLSCVRRGQSVRSGLST